MSSLGTKVVTYAKSKVGKQVHDGECFYLADYALKDAGAKTAADYGDVSPDADYVWGDEVTVEKTQGGDILQFRNYEGKVTVDVAVTIDFAKDESITYYADDPRDGTITYDHHTAVAAGAISQGAVNVLEQNVDRGSGRKEKIVRARDLYLKSVGSRTSNSTKRVTINRAWGTAVKKGMTKPEHKKWVDGLVSKYNNKTFSAKVATTISIKVSGSIWVYRAESR